MKKNNETSMKAIVLFDTLYGNTERIVSRLEKGLQEVGIDSEYVNIKAVMKGKGAHLVHLELTLQRVDVSIPSDRLGYRRTERDATNIYYFFSIHNSTPVKSTEPK